MELVSINKLYCTNIKSTLWTLLVTNIVKLTSETMQITFVSLLIEIRMSIHSYDYQSAATTTVIFAYRARNGDSGSACYYRCYKIFDSVGLVRPQRVHTKMSMIGSITHNIHTRNLHIIATAYLFTTTFMSKWPV